MLLAATNWVGGAGTVLISGDQVNLRLPCWITLNVWASLLRSKCQTISQQTLAEPELLRDKVRAEDHGYPSTKGKVVNANQLTK